MVNATVNLPTLFKMSSTGATQEWRIAVIPNTNGTAIIQVTYGQKGGKMQVTPTIIKAGKNEGRSNQTDCYSQAKAEALSKWKKQKDKGYGESEFVARPTKKPMLAQEYHKYAHQVKFPAYAQPKLDGIRCLAIKENGRVNLMSRGGKPIMTMGHLIPGLEEVMYDGQTYDGELYIHGEKFRDLTSWIKRLQKNTGRIQYHVYDCIDPQPFPQRVDEIFSMIRGFEPHNVIVVDRHPVTDARHLKRLHDMWVSQGYEGAMLRHNGCPYKEGYRSRDLLKYKECITEEFEIIGAGEGKGKFEGMAVFNMRTKAGAVFDCMPQGTAEERREYFTNLSNYVGKMMTVKFQEWTTSKQSVPRFPVGIAIREDDE